MVFVLHWLPFSCGNRSLPFRWLQKYIFWILIISCLILLCMQYFVFYIVHRIFQQNSACSLNLAFVPFCEIFVGERTPDFTTMKGNGFYNFKHQLSEQLTDYCTCTQPVYNLAQTTTTPTVVILFLCTPLFLSTLHILPLQIYHSSVLLALLYLLRHHGLFCLYLPNLTSLAHIVYRLIFLLYY